MQKLKKVGKKLIAYILTLCMISGMVAALNLTEFTTSVSAATTGFTKYDFLKCDGTYIKNNYGKGNNVYLRGTNIGNLFVQESWMSSTNATDQKVILNALTSRFGQDKALELLDYYESNYFTTADLDNCKNMGMSVIRVPFTYMNLYKQSGNNWVVRSDAFDRLDWIVEEAGKRGIYVILDLHGAFGSQNGMDHSGEVIENASNVTFFSNETLMSQTLDLWKMVAQHYVGNPTVAGYDTLNEPGEKAGTTSERHWNFYNRMYNTIRSVDPDHIIIMESCWGTGDLPNPSRYGWTNVMYEYHHYPWNYVDDNDANYQGQVNAINNLVNSVNNANYGVPTYIGEFNCFDGDAKWNYVLDKMNKEGWHYTNWSYKSRGMGSWGIYHEAGNEKVQPWSSSESDIRRIWGSSSVGTNVNDRGVTYNNMRTKLPGTVVFADKALDDSSYFSIKANVNNKYVCADNYGESNLVADRDSGGEWEQFRTIKNSDGTYSFQARANNKYLCAVFDDTDTENPVIARSSAIGTWEKFYVEKQTDGTYALRTFENNYYVQADINDTTSGKLHAIGTSVGTWERFVLEAVSDPSALPDAQQPVEEETTKDTPPVENATNIPGTVKVSSYTSKTDTVSLTTSGSTTYAGNFNDGSNITFRINATQSNDYAIKLNLAAGDTQWNADSVRVSIDGNTVATVPVKATSGWEVFVQNTARINGIGAGVHTLTLTTLGGSCNIADFSMEIAGEEIATLPEESLTKSANRVVGYMPYYRSNTIDSIDFSALTHCVLSFLMYKNGNIVNDFNDSDVRKIVSKCKANNVKVLIALGGGGGFDVSTQPFGTAAKRTSIINALMDFVNKYDLDGVDIDIEVNDSNTWNNFDAFISELSGRLKASNKLLTMAVSTWFTDPIQTSTYQYFDFLNLMSYDAAFGDGPVAPWSTIYEQISYYKNRGMRDDQLVIGVPFYGYDASSNYIPYNEIIQRNSDYRNYDYAGGIYFNGEATIRQKTEYSKDFGGIMIWELGQDSYGQYSLLQIIKDTMATTADVDPTITKVPGNVPVSSFVTKTSNITMNTSGNTTYAGNLNDGSELNYYIEVQEKGTYTINLKLAAGDVQYNAKNMLVKLNNTTVATIPVRATNGWESFENHAAEITFPLKGQYKISIVADSGACNVADFTLTKKSETTTEETTQKPEPTTKEPETTKEPVVKEGIYLNGANSTTAIGLEGNHDFTDAYVWKGNPQYPQADNSYKYLVLTYTGDITDIRLGNDSNPPTEVYWFGAGHEDGTNHSFVTPQGTTVPANGNNTTVVIDLEKSGTAGSFFKSFHVHTGSSGKTGSLNITEAYLSQKNPLGEETTTEEPTTEKPTEAPTEKPTEEPTTEEPTTEEPTTEKTYTVSVDGKTVMTAKEGETYTLPRTARVGYYAEGKMYKKGSTYTVTKDVNFSSVDLTANTGASIRLADPSGLTFKAAITCSDSSLFTSDAIVNEGMLITTNDIYSEEGSLDFTSEYTYVNIENSGWNGGVAGAFTGTIAGIRSMNYGRTYIARAYVTVKFADGTESVTYSKMTGVRSVRSVATSMKNTPSVYNGLTAAQKALIDRFVE